MPQPCQYGDHPAVRSLLFRDGEAYVPVCDEHEQEARDQIIPDGGEVSGAVEIEEPDVEIVEDEVVVAAAAPRPPAAWFADPQLDGPTPLTIDEDGRIRGHAAVFGTCHIGFPQQCVTAPRSRSGYAYFATGAVVTDEGQVPVGSITMDAGHAPTKHGPPGGGLPLRPHRRRRRGRRSRREPARHLGGGHRPRQSADSRLQADARTPRSSSRRSALRGGGWTP